MKSSWERIDTNEGAAVAAERRCGRRSLCQDDEGRYCQWPWQAGAPDSELRYRNVPSCYVWAARMGGTCGRHVWAARMGGMSAAGRSGGYSLSTSRRGRE